MDNANESPPIYNTTLGWALCAVVFIYLNLDFLQRLAIVPLAIALELALAVIVFQVINWADAYEPEPLLAMLWAVFAGASISILIVSFVYESNVFDNHGALFVGIVEEVAKAIILVPIFRSKLIHSWIDGYVYGALIGLGFSISEDYLYAALDNDPVNIILARGLETIFAHSLFSGLIGASIAFAVSQKHNIGLIFALSGVFAHVMWNTLIVEIAMTETLLVGLLTPALFIYLASLLRKVEIKSITSIATNLINEEKINLHEFNLITNLSYRNAIRKSHKTREARKEFDIFIINIVTGRV